MSRAAVGQVRTGDGPLSRAAVGQGGKDRGRTFVPGSKGTGGDRERTFVQDSIAGKMTRLPARTEKSIDHGGRRNKNERNSVRRGRDTGIVSDAGEIQRWCPTQARCGDGVRCGYYAM